MPSVTPLVTERTMDGRLGRTQQGYEGLRVFDVKAASDVDALATLRSERGITYGSLLRNAQGEMAGGPLTRATSLDTRPKAPAPIGGSGLFEVRVEYRTLNLALNNNQPPPEPGGPPVYRWGRSSQSKALEVDLDGLAMENSRGEPVDPLPSSTVPARTLTVEWYESTYNLQYLLGYDGAVNNDVWLIAGRWQIAIGQALCLGIDPFDETDDLKLMHAEFEFKPGGTLWHPFTYADTAYARKGELIRIGNEDVVAEGGEKIYLDGNGNPLNLGAVALGEYMDPVLIERRTTPLKAFSELGI